MSKPLTKPITLTIGDNTDSAANLARAEIRTLKDSPPKRRRSKAGVPSASD